MCWVMCEVKVSRVALSMENAMHFLLVCAECCDSDDRFITISFKYIVLVRYRRL